MNIVHNKQRLVSKDTTVVDRLAVVGPPGIPLHHENVHKLGKDVDEACNLKKCVVLRAEWVYRKNNANRLKKIPFKRYTHIWLILTSCSPSDRRRLQSRILEGTTLFFFFWNIKVHINVNLGQYKRHSKSNYKYSHCSHLIPQARTPRALEETTGRRTKVGSDFCPSFLTPRVYLTALS